MDEIKREFIKQLIPQIGPLVATIVPAFGFIITAILGYVAFKIHSLSKAVKDDRQNRAEVAEVLVGSHQQIKNDIIKAVDGGAANKLAREIESAQDLDNETSPNRPAARADRREGDAMDTKAGQPIEPKEEPLHGTA